MLTVPEAARRVNRDPETIRRWIRSGRLRAETVGTRHMIDENELIAVVGSGMLPLPQGWKYTVSGGAMPNVVDWVRRTRAQH